MGKEQKMSATTLLKSGVTETEFLEHYVHEDGIELIDGEIVRLPMPGSEHGEVCGNAYHYLREWIKPRKLGRVMTNDTFVRTKIDPSRFRGADVCYVSYSILPAEVPTPKSALFPPLELVVEVRSPSDSMPEMAAKALEYVEAGVAVVVVLDPNTDTASVFRSDSPIQRLQGTDDLTLPDILPGFSVRVSKLFE